MRRLALLSLASLAAAVSAVPVAEAQTRRVVAVQQGAPVILTVRPRSFLDAGRVAPVGSQSRYASTQIQQYVNNPPYHHSMRDQFGGGLLPDDIHGPFVGARNAFGPGVFQQ